MSETYFAFYDASAVARMTRDYQNLRKVDRDARSIDVVRSHWLFAHEFVRESHEAFRLSGSAIKTSAEVAINTVFQSGHASITSGPFGGSWRIIKVQKVENPLFQECYYFLTRNYNPRSLFGVIGIGSTDYVFHQEPNLLI